MPTHVFSGKEHPGRSVVRLKHPPNQSLFGLKTFGSVGQRQKRELARPAGFEPAISASGGVAVMVFCQSDARGYVGSCR